MKPINYDYKSKKSWGLQGMYFSHHGKPAKAGAELEVGDRAALTAQPTSLA